MHLAVLGASGRTGRPLVDQALATGHMVTVLVRDAARAPAEHERLRVVVGDAGRAEDIGAAVRGADAVLSVLGHAKGAPPDVQTAATRHVVAALRASGGGRLLSLTGAGVPDPNDPPYLPAVLVRAVMRAVTGAVLADAIAHAAVLRAAPDVGWTLVRAPRLTNGPKTGRYRTGYLKLGPTHHVARADVADFMLHLATRGGFEHEAPMITADEERPKTSGR